MNSDPPRTPNLPASRVHNAPRPLLAPHAGSTSHLYVTGTLLRTVVSDQRRFRWGTLFPQFAHLDILIPIQPLSCHRLAQAPITCIPIFARNIPSCGRTTTKIPEVLFFLRWLYLHFKLIWAVFVLVTLRAASSALRKRFGSIRPRMQRYWFTASDNPTLIFTYFQIQVNFKLGGASHPREKVFSRRTYVVSNQEEGKHGRGV